MELQDYRNQIDEIDHKLVNLFIQRMKLSAQIAAYKNERKLPIFVPERECEILEQVGTLAENDLAEYVKELYACLFKLSRNYQKQCFSKEKS